MKIEVHKIMKFTIKDKLHCICFLVAVTNQTYIVMDEDDLNGIGGLLVISD